MPPALHRRRFLAGLTVLPLLALGSAPVFAQVGRRYRVELVLFEHLSTESRVFQAQVARELQPNLRGFAIGEGAIRPSGLGFELHTVVDRVERGGYGRVLAQLAWDQLGRDYYSAPWVRIQAGRYLGPRDGHEPEGPEFESGLGSEFASGFASGAGAGLRVLQPEEERYELEGRLRVWVGRFLHLETELIFHNTQHRDSEPPRANAAPEVLAPPPPAISVRGSQRMQSGGDLFYLDHPVVGAIARVTRL